MAEQTTTYAAQAGCYRFDDRIPSGEAGEAWRATDTVLDRGNGTATGHRKHGEGDG